MSKTIFKGCILLLLLVVGCATKSNLSKLNPTSPTRLDDYDNVMFYNPTLFNYLPYKLLFDIKEPENVRLEGRNMNISQIKDNYYNITFIDSTAIRNEITIYRKIKQEEIKEQTILFRVHDIPITTRFASKKSGQLLTLEEIKKYYLTADVINFDIQLSFPIRSFSISTVVNDTLKKINTSGNKISEDQYSYIQKLNHLSPIIFTQIMIEKQDGRLEPQQPIIYYLNKKE